VLWFWNDIRYGKVISYPDEKNLKCPNKHPRGKCSVADPGCLSRILIFTHPGSQISDPGSRIPDPKNSNKSEKKFVVIPFFCSHKFHKIENYLIFEMLKKKIWPIFKELYNFLFKKLSLCSQKYGFGIRDPEKTYPGSRGQKGTGSRIRIRNTGQM
jgi:hypothetical protein